MEGHRAMNDMTISSGANYYCSEIDFLIAEKNLAFSNFLISSPYARIDQDVLLTQEGYRHLQHIPKGRH